MSIFSYQPNKRGLMTCACGPLDGPPVNGTRYCQCGRFKATHTGTSEVGECVVYSNWDGGGWTKIFTWWSRTAEEARKQAEQERAEAETRRRYHDASMWFFWQQQERKRKR